MVLRKQALLTCSSRSALRALSAAGVAAAALVCSSSSNLPSSFSAEVFESLFVKLQLLRLGRAFVLCCFLDVSHGCFLVVDC